MERVTQKPTSEIILTSQSVMRGVFFFFFLLDLSTNCSTFKVSCPSVSQSFFFFFFLSIPLPFLPDTAGFRYWMERSKIQMCCYKNILECVCVCCNRAVNPAEGKVIPALRQGKNLSAGLSTSTTGPVLTSPAPRSPLPCSLDFIC